MHLVINIGCAFYRIKNLTFNEKGELVDAWVMSTGKGGFLMIFKGKTIKWFIKVPPHMTGWDSTRVIDWALYKLSKEEQEAKDKKLSPKLKAELDTLVKN